MVLESILTIIIGIILIVAPRFLVGAGTIATYIRIGAFLIGLGLIIYGVYSLFTEFTSGL